MNKHTPGEWIAAFPKAQFPHIQTSDGKQVVKTDCSINSEKWVEDYGECVANARLIAAAPELLEALEACLPVIESECVALASVAGWDSTYDELHVKARILKDKASSAIAKARGL